MIHTEKLLDDLAEVLPGFAFRGSIQDESPGEVRVMTMAHALGDALMADTVLPRIAFGGDADKFRLLAGDLIFRSKGISNQSVLVEGVLQPTIFASPLIRIRVHDRQAVDAHYLHWVLNSAPIQRDISVQARGSMIRMVSLSSVRGLLIPVPPLRVQLEIAEIARLLREERALCAALLSTTQTYAEHLLWAKAQAATTP